jgi:phosphohistidine phosphatase
MKRLYLIRHAKSSKDIAGIKDKERPLNRQGRRQVGYIGQRFKKLGSTPPQVFYSSPAKRALDTAVAIAKEIGFPSKRIKVVNSLYHANIPKLMKVIKKIDDAAGSAALFGHNPEFFDLVNYLTPRAIKKFPTCGIFGVDLCVGSWKRTARKKGRIVFSDDPRGMSS